MPQTGLIKRGSIYYLRLRVPADLVSHYGKAELKASLKTKERSQAIPLLRAEMARLEQEFADIRKKAKQAFIFQDLTTRRVTWLDDETIEAIAASWLQQNLLSDDLLRSEGDIANLKDDIRQTVDALKAAYATGNTSGIEPMVRQFVSFMGIELSVSDAQWRSLCIKFMEAFLQAAQIRAQRLEGDAISTASVMATVPAPLTPPSAPGNGYSLTQVLERWQKVADRLPRTASEMASLVRRFETYSKHKLVKTLTRQDGIGWRDFMRDHDKVIIR